MRKNRLDRLMSRVVLLTGAIALLTGCGREPGVIDLHVLYAGDLTLERAADWQGFLTEHFTRVDTIAVSRLSEETAAEAEVVIIDGSYSLEDNRIHLPKVPALSRDFTRPVIMIGAAAGKTLMQMDLKLDWM